MKRRGRSKILILSLFTLLGVTAVTGTAAQAEWELREGGVGVLHLKVSGTFSLGEIRSDLANIHCKSGVLGFALAQLANDHKTWTSKSFGIGSKCQVVEFNACAVRSRGEEVGTIAMSGEGEGQMEGSKTYALSGSKELSTIIVEGALCPLGEIEEPLSGLMTLTFLNPESEQKIHGIALDEDSIFYGESEALLLGEKSSAIEGEAEAESGEAWAIRLK